MAAHLIAEEGPSRGLIFDINEGEEQILGRDPDEASFVLEDPTVSRKHARLFYAPEGVYLENLSRVSPTLMNEEPIDGHVLLKEGDRIQIGRSLFLFTEKEVERSPKKELGNYEKIFEALEKSPHSPANPPTGYDTIFEDRGEEEPLPFSFVPETPFILKVISGPNAGAEIGLEKGKSYTIGKDPHSADIVFQDLSVSRKHAELSIDLDGVIVIEDLGSKNQVLVNGVSITGKTNITPQDMVSLGTTVFLVVDREAPQETLYSPLPTLNKATEDEVVPVEEIAPEAVLTEKDWKKQPVPFKYLAAIGASLLTAFILFMTFFSLFKTETVMEVAAKDPTVMVKKSLEKFEGVQFSFNPASGKLFLVGHLLTAVEAQEMLYRVSELDFVTSVENNVVIDEFVDKMMNDLLSGNPNFRQVTIQTQAPGKFVAMGYVDTNAQGVALAEYLAVNFPYLDRLENQVAIGENMVIQIQSLLQSKGFAAVAFQLANGEVILSGNYSNKKMSEFDKTLKEIQEIPGIRGIRNFALPTNPNQAAIDISDQYRVTGIAEHDGKGYSAILNGRVYEVGSQMAGLTIVEIDPNTILLEKDGIRYKINYAR